jgi:putative ABC transport system permease protein
MLQLLHDLRLAIRALARRPAFCAVVIATLALGIGANSAIFSVVNAVLLKPLPYRAPDELTLIWSRWSNFDKTWLSEAEFLDYERMTRLFKNAAAWGDNGEVALTGTEGPESVAAMQMTANLPEVVGMAPALGRTFSADEDVPNGPAVVMLGYDLWQRRYGSDRSLVGRTITVDGQPARVVGILPKEFRFPLEFQSLSPVQLIQPVGLNRSSPQRGNHGLYGIARLQPGITAEAVSLELKALTSRWTSEGLYPVAMNFTAFAVPLVQEVSGSVRRTLVVLAAAVGLLLLLTCANVANLILARADGRARELAVRAALGAGRREIARLALTESLLLSLAGALAGLALAWAGVRLLIARAPTTIPRLAEVSIDFRVLGFTLLVAVLTGILFGLAPILSGARRPLADALREGGRSQSGGPAARRGRTLLVVAEMGLAVLLVIGAGLTIRSLLNLLDINPGFDPRGALTLRLSLPQSQYASNESVAGFYQQLGDEVRRLPGVEAAGFVRLLPLASSIGDAGMVIEGRPVNPGEPGRSADWEAVTPGYFEAMRMRLVRGRFINDTDTPEGLPVIAINETLAREYFPGVDPLGQRIRVGNDTRPFRTIVGVIGDVHHNGITAPVKRMWFVPHGQWPQSYDGPRRAMTLVVRGSGDPRALLEPVSRLVHQHDPDLTISQVASLEEVLAAATREQRFTVALMTGFAALALILAAVGIYGVISYSVSRRTGEIGIRMALGAEAGSVRVLVLRQGMIPALVGIGAGLGAAVLLTRFLRSLLYGVAPIDPLTFTLIPVGLALIAVGSVMIPATRASRVQPVEALRGE